jgi:hypothetical protein
MTYLSTSRPSTLISLPFVAVRFATVTTSSGLGFRFGRTAFTTYSGQPFTAEDGTFTTTDNS